MVSFNGKDACGLAVHLKVELIKGHDRSEVEEREVEVILEQVQEAVVPVLPLTVLQAEAHASHDTEPTTAVEQDILKLESSCDESRL